MACKLVKAITLKWYKILSYTGPDIIKQFLKHINGVVLIELTNK